MQQIGEAVKTRRAFWGDLDDIFWIIKPNIDSKDLLPKDITDLSENIRDFVVLEQEGAVIGCGGLHRHNSHLGEIHTIAVDGPFRGRGLGTLIVRTLLEQAKSERISDLYLFTRKPTFFETLGFVKANQDEFGIDNRCAELRASSEVAVLKACL